MTVLSDRQIRCLCVKLAMVSPYIEDNLQPASLDVRLGDEFKVFVPHDEIAIDMDDPADITQHVKVVSGGGFIIHPGEFVLGVTREHVTIPNDIVSRIEGKSSIGRLGLMVHVTAGFIDPGFRGPITLEMANLMRVPIVLRPGMLIAQLSFERMTEAAQRPYQGRYQNATGVESSRFGSK